MAYNSKSLDNLVPFRKGEDSRRQQGRKKGSLNRRTVIKQLLSDQITPELIFSQDTRERLKGMGDKTYLEALTMTLINQGLNGDSQASNILLRELRKLEDEEPKGAFFQDTTDLQITVISSGEELEQIEEARAQLDNALINAKHDEK